jgi:hypothetical protein
MNKQATAVRKWLRLCARRKANPIRVCPATANQDQFALMSEFLLMAFADEVVNKDGNLPSTAAQYISAIRTWHENLTGLEIAKGIKQARLKKQLKSLTRKKGRKRKVRKAVTRAMLLQLKEYMDLSNPEHANMWLLIVLAFRFLLRPGEVVKGAGKWDPAVHLTRADIKWASGANHGTLLMRPLKKGPGQRKDCEIPFPDDRGADLSIVDAFAAVNTADPVKGGMENTTPMCRWPDKKRPMTVPDVRKLVKWMAMLCELDPSEWNGHSLRIGGATALHAAGCPELVIKTIGRWSSDIFQIYARAELHQLLDYSAKMAEVNAKTLEMEVESWVV